MTTNDGSNDAERALEGTPASASSARLKREAGVDNDAVQQDDGTTTAADSTPIRPAKRVRMHHDDDVQLDAPTDGETGTRAARGGGVGEDEGQEDKHAQALQHNGKQAASGGKKNKAGSSGGRGSGRDKKGTYDKRGARQQQQQQQGTNTNKAAGDSTPSSKERLPKKKVAVLVGYNGTGYKGSQINPGMPTLEGTIFEAMVKAGVVGLSRAARTDAGVHAAFNVLSLKMILAPPSKPADVSLEDHINTFLPPTIRVWTIIRVQGAFNPRTMCDQRQYEYTMPTHVLLGPKPGTIMADWLSKSRAAASKSPTAVPTASASDSGPTGSSSSLPSATIAAEQATKEFWSRQPEGTTFAQDLVEKRKWRITPELLQAARAFVAAYEGSHNFYNFTISDPFVVNGTEYVSVGFLGQSFMLHQIRKMIGLVILAVRSGTPPSLIAETFGPSRIHIPKAPALGLVLIGPQYMEYNRRIQESNKKYTQLKTNGKVSAKEAEDGTRDEIIVQGDLLNKINEFKMETLYGPMRDREDKENVYLNPKGVIPASAIYQRGQDPEKTRAAAASSASTRDSSTVAQAHNVEGTGSPEDDDEDLQVGADDG
ncbi:tRNA pseudouridine synthase 1 [Microbotryomycetes sp. JL201]|nr:tRNA pseudouridine synthase 1 [Microbotryomycetes sp. JL201]